MEAKHRGMSSLKFDMQTGCLFIYMYIYIYLYEDKIIRSEPSTLLFSMRINSHRLCAPSSKRLQSTSEELVKGVRILQ